MPTFLDFASWIQQKSHIARLYRSSRLDRDKYKPSSSQSHAEASPKATAPTSLQAFSQPTSSQKVQQSMKPKAQRNKPGGDKEYRDSVRRRPSPTGTPTSWKKLPSIFFNQTKPSKSREKFAKVQQTLVCMVHREWTSPQSLHI